MFAESIFTCELSGPYFPDAKVRKYMTVRGAMKIRDEEGIHISDYEPKENISN